LSDLAIYFTSIVSNFILCINRIAAMKYLYITILSLCLFFNANAQSKVGKSNIGGQWKGTVTQNDGGYKSSYSFELYLTQRGNTVTGRSYVFIEDIFAVIELKGTVKSGKLIFIEETIILDHRKYEDMEWCVKKMQLVLTYEGDELKLDGYWQGKSPEGDCIPGEIHLKKEVPRA
jgi:hypothetical protein